MVRGFLTLIIVASLLFARAFATETQAPDGTIKITSRMVAPGIGLSWGDGLLNYKGRDYPFTFKAGGLFRDVDAEMTAAELSGQVFNLKKLEDFAGNYQNLESEGSVGGGASRATVKNQNGVIVDLRSTVEGRKFNLAREGIDIQLKQ